MNKQELLKDYKNQEDKLLLAVVLDKIEFCKSKNKIECTDFLNLAEQDLVDKFLKRINFKNYYFFGGAGEAERKILNLMSEGTEFIFHDKYYKVILSGKPTCQKGEPKTDIYVLAKSEFDKVEIKISYKKENADFIENKMSSERAAQLLGENWADIIERSTTAISERFEERMLIYKNKFKRTEKGSITLGWKFELLNKNNGELSGKMMLTEQQIIDVYSGSNLSEDKRNAYIDGKMIENSGVANYILMEEDISYYK